MNKRDLRDEVGYDLAQMLIVVDELQALRRDVGEHEPTLREIMAAGAFLSSFYNGVENILKRISKYHGIPLPTGDQWHVKLLDRFREPLGSGLPALLSESLVPGLDMVRRFRHVARTSYGMELDWAKVATGIDEIGFVFERFRTAVTDYLDRLG